MVCMMMIYLMINIVYHIKYASSQSTIIVFPDTMETMKHLFEFVADSFTNNLKLVNLIILQNLAIIFPKSQVSNVILT